MAPGVDPDTGKPKRRVARWDELPPETHPLVERLVEARLLIRDRRILIDEQEAVVVEIAHEALLRQWPTLTIWLDRDSEDLRMVEAVKRSAVEWNSKGRGESWLTHSGPRLESAETLQHRPDFYRLLGEMGQLYLKQCRAKQKTESRRRKRQGLYIALLTLSIVLILSIENWGLLRWDPGRNEPWPKGTPVPDTAGSWKITDLELKDGRFVALAISGPGSRAANFAAAIMLELERRGLLEQVDVISSVSGGTLPTVYYSLGEQAGSFAETAIREALGYNFEGSRMQKRFSPENFLLTRISEDFTSSHVMVQVLNDHLFHEKTFVDLRPHPKILISGTLMNGLTRFTFTDDRFQTIGSSLGSYQLANAVYASMAMPGVLEGIYLQQTSISGPPQESLQISDGGITDKLAVQAVLEYLIRNILGTTLDRLFPNGCIIIAIDPTSAREGTSRDSFLNTLPDLMEGLLIEARRALLKEMGIPLYRQDQEMRGRLSINDPRQCGCEIRHVALRHLVYTSDDSDLSERVTQIPAKFWISQEEQNDLFQAAKLLMKELDDNHLLRDDSFKINCGDESNSTK